MIGRARGIFDSFIHSFSFIWLHFIWFNSIRFDSIRFESSRFRAISFHSIPSKVPETPKPRNPFGGLQQLPSIHFDSIHGYQFAGAIADARKQHSIFSLARKEGTGQLWLWLVNVFIPSFPSLVSLSEFFFFFAFWQTFKMKSRWKKAKRKPNWTPTIMCIKWAVRTFSRRRLGYWTLLALYLS